LTIKNIARSGILIGNVAAGSAPFTVTSGSGPFNLAPAHSEAVTVEFAPSASGAASAAVVITSNDPKHPSVSVKLTGTGVAGKLSLPTRLAFPKTAALDSPISGKLTIKNAGLGVLHGNVGAITGPFSVSAGSGGFALDHLQPWTVAIQFTPTAKGPATGTLAITSDDPKHPSVSLNLKGTGE
jgi:hypothetical protein